MRRGVLRGGEEEEEEPAGERRANNGIEARCARGNERFLRPAPAARWARNVAENVLPRGRGGFPLSPAFAQRPPALALSTRARTL